MELPLLPSLSLSLSLSRLPPIKGPRSKDPDRNPPEDFPKLLLPLPVPSVVTLFFILITPSGGAGDREWAMGGSVIELMDDAGEDEGDPEKKDVLLGLIL